MDFLEYILPIGFVIMMLVQYLRTSAKQRAANRGSGNASGGFMNRVAQAIEEARAEQAQRNTVHTPPIPQRNAAPPLPYEREEQNHFSEERLVEEFIRTHKAGKTIAHHTHDYFDPATDQNTSRTQDAKKRRRVARKNLFQKKNIRRAIIMKEIMDRPDF